MALRWQAARALRAARREDALLPPRRPDAFSAEGLPLLVQAPLSGAGELDLVPPPVTPRSPEASSSRPEAPRGEGVPEGAPAAASGSGALPAPWPAKRRKDDTAVAPQEARASRATAKKLINNPAAWAGAKEDFRGAMLQPSSEATLDSRLKTCQEFVFEALRVPLLPLTEDKLVNLGAALRGAHYLSGPEHLRVARAEHIASNASWTGALQRCHSRCIRACKRGRGPVTRAGLGDIERFAVAPEITVGVVERGPLAASTYTLTCIAFLLREIEGSLIAMRQVELLEDIDGRSLRLHLPSSKVDYWGSGASRTLVCTCRGARRMELPCVVCRVAAQVEARQAQGAGQEDPLFPDGSGRFPSKEAAVATLRSVLVPVEGEISGHSPRRMGAQLLATLGVSEEAVCWFGRWGSVAVRAYLADARARSRAGKRIWADALALDAAARSAPALPEPPALQIRFEAERKAEVIAPPPVASAFKTFVLNKETRRMHVFAPNASASLCNFMTLSKASAVPNPVLQGRAWRGREVSPCRRCRGLAMDRGMLQGSGGQAGGESSSSADSSDASDS